MTTTYKQIWQGLDGRVYQQLQGPPSYSQQSRLEQPTTDDDDILKDRHDNNISPEADLAMIGWQCLSAAARASFIFSTIRLGAT